MARLGPFEPAPRLAVAASGGADSTALALLAQEWAVARGGSVLALTVDHGLRPESGAEASATIERLSCHGIEARLLTIANLPRGSALAERAREARYRLLLDACVRHGIPHLLLGHHRGDQVETVMMRALSSSTARGLAGIPALAETRFVRLLRPLLDVPPGHLRAFLTGRGVAWIEDPSNQHPAALRARLRIARADPDGTSGGTEAAAEAARSAGQRRAVRDQAIAGILADRATIRPEGYALLTPGPIDPEALAALVRIVGGGTYGPSLDNTAALARSPGPATLGGVRIMAAGRLGDGWLLVRERRGMEAPAPARLGLVWDARFRMTGVAPDRDAAAIGALGRDAARFRDRHGPPAAVLHGLPAVRMHGTVAAVPHLGFGDARWRVIFDPRNPAAGAPFLFG